MIVIMFQGPIIRKPPLTEPGERKGRNQTHQGLGQLMPPENPFLRVWAFGKPWIHLANFGSHLHIFSLFIYLFIYLFLFLFCLRQK